MTETNAPTNEQYNATFMRDAITDVVSGLHRLADTLDRLASDVSRVGGPGRATYAGIASEVHHTLAWGVANLNAQRVITYAGDADIARAKGE